MGDGLVLDGGNQGEKEVFVFISVSMLIRSLIYNNDRATLSKKSLKSLTVRMLLSTRSTDFTLTTYPLILEMRRIRRGVSGMLNKVEMAGRGG